MYLVVIRVVELLSGAETLYRAAVVHIRGRGGCVRELAWGTVVSVIRKGGGRVGECEGESVGKRKGASTSCSITPALVYPRLLISPTVQHQSVCLLRR